MEGLHSRSKELLQLRRRSGLVRNEAERHEEVPGNQVPGHCGKSPAPAAVVDTSAEKRRPNARCLAEVNSTARP